MGLLWPGYGEVRGCYGLVMVKYGASTVYEIHYTKHKQKYIEYDGNLLEARANCTVSKVL